MSGVENMVPKVPVLLTEKVLPCISCIVSLFVRARCATALTCFARPASVSWPASALVGAGVALAATGAGDGCKAAGADGGVADGDGDVGAVAAGDGCGCEDRADT